MSTKTIIASIGTGAVVLLSLAACGSTAALTSHPAAATPKTSTSAPAKPSAPATTAPRAAKPAAPKPPAAAPAPVPRWNQPGSGTDYSNSVSVVTQFYQDITDHDYPAAWSLGGDNIGGTNYASWAAGYATTESISLGEFSQFGSSQVQVDLSALQNDGTVNNYTGTYTVLNGVITVANIVQTAGTSTPQASPAQPQPGSADTNCGGTIYAGPNTSCAFAENVAAAYDSGTGGSQVLTVYSPATGQNYTMTYTQYGNLVEATGGNGADVLFYL